MPGVVAALLWGFLYLPSVSPFSFVLDALGLPQPDLLDGGPLYAALSNIAVWGGTGFNMIVIYTALRPFRPRCTRRRSWTGDAAADRAADQDPDGGAVAGADLLLLDHRDAAGVQRAHHLKPLTNSVSTTWSPLMKVYQDAFGNGDIHAAAAQATLIAVATLVLSFGFLRTANRRTKQEAGR